MYCGQCGTPNQDEAGHCETCGAPLLITTGSRTCGTCGASLGDHDRFCTTCGASATDAAESSGYDASDDFGDIDIDDIQLEELPDWLQEMAPSDAPSSDAQVPGMDAQQRPANQPAPDDLPDWLRDVPESGTGPAPGGGPASPTPPADPGPIAHQPADEFSLVSDEDLPDWLKALSDDDDAADQAPPQQPAPAAQRTAGRQEQQPTRAVANLYEVPAVSRAWLTQARSVDPDQVTAARQEFSPLEALSGVSTEHAGRQSIWDDGPVESTDDDEETRPFAVASEEETAEEGTNRTQLIIRIVVLVLIVIVVALLAFILLQGV